MPCWGGHVSMMWWPRHGHVPSSPPPPLRGSGITVPNRRDKPAYLSKSVRREESLKPLANGLLSIFSLVICNKEGGTWSNSAWYVIKQCVLRHQTMCSPRTSRISGGVVRQMSTRGSTCRAFLGDIRAARLGGDFYHESSYKTIYGLMTIKVEIKPIKSLGKRWLN